MAHVLSPLTVAAPDVRGRTILCPRPTIRRSTGSARSFPERRQRCGQGSDFPAGPRGAPSSTPRRRRGRRIAMRPVEEEGRIEQPVAGQDLASTPRRGLQPPGDNAIPAARPRRRRRAMPSGPSPTEPVGEVAPDRRRCPNRSRRLDGRVERRQITPRSARQARNRRRRDGPPWGKRSRSDKSPTAIEMAAPARRGRRALGPFLLKGGPFVEDACAPARPVSAEGDGAIAARDGVIGPNWGGPTGPVLGRKNPSCSEGGDPPRRWASRCADWSGRLARPFAAAPCAEAGRKPRQGSGSGIANKACGFHQAHENRHGEGHPAARWSRAARDTALGLSTTLAAGSAVLWQW